jgi:hypothetical protein
VIHTHIYPTLVAPHVIDPIGYLWLPKTPSDLKMQRF